MATPHLFFSIFILLCNHLKISSSSCTLNFTQFPYEAKAECFDMGKGSAVAILTAQSCCDSALQYIFQAMAIRTNQSQSIFLEQTEAQDCTNEFQNLHQRTDLSRCQLQDHVSSSAPNQCSKGVDSVKNTIGVDKYNTLQSNCKDLSMTNYSDDSCYNCVMSFRESLEILKGSTDNSKGCPEALLLSLASSDVNSPNWVPGTFSCLWNEIHYVLPTKNRNKGDDDNFLLGSKKLLAIVLVAAGLVILAPILYKLTKKQLRYTSEKDIENLSVTVLKKTLEDESRSPFISSDMYIFSPVEIAKATNSFDPINLIGEGSLGKTVTLEISNSIDDLINSKIRLGKVYVGAMPSGMRVAIKRLNERNHKLHTITDEIYRKAKVRHPNLVSTLGCCDRGDICLVYEYCVNGDLPSWFDGRRISILSWEQRLQISIGIARGLWFLHNNPLEKIVHGNIKLSNILLNERLEPKISDAITASCKPKNENRVATREDDVLQFGVVLLQILTGRNKPKSLVEEARDTILKGAGSIKAMVDPRLFGAYVSIEFKNILSIAVLCTSPEQHERPNMEQVVRKLEETQILV